MPMFIRDIHRSGRMNSPVEGTVEAFFFVSTPVVDNISSTTARVSWAMSEVCTGQVEYGLTASYGSTTTFQNIAGGYSSHIQWIPNLSPGTEYHFRIVSTNAQSVTVYSADITFTTAGSQPISPDNALPPAVDEADLTYETTTATSQPPYLVQQTDPVFGTKFMRISDTDGLRPRYSNLGAWNCDQTRIILDYPPRTLLDASDYTVIASNLNTPSWAMWSFVDPDLMYGSGSNGYIRRFVPSTNTIAAFRPTRPSGGYYDAVYSSGSEQTGLTHDDRYMVFTWESGSDKGFAVLDLTTDTVAAEHTFSSGVMVSGGIGITGDGQYLVTSWGSTAIGSGEDQGAEVYSFDGSSLTRERSLTTHGWHSDLGVDYQGNNVACIVRQSATGGGNGSDFGYYRLDTGAWTKVADIPHSHVSCRNWLRPGYALLSTYDPYTTNEPGSGELLFVELKPEAQAQVHRFGHTHRRIDLGYDSDPMATVSPDGTKVLWGTAWDYESEIYAYVASRWSVFDNPYANVGTTYDTYGAGANGDFPPFPTIGGNVVLLPSATASAGYSAVETFINSQPSGTTIVFDSSGGGTDYGAGTEIVLTDCIQINHGNNTLKSDVTLWGYNCRIRQTQTTDVSHNSRILWFEGGGSENWQILGFDLMGPNTGTGTYDVRTGVIADEEGHAIEAVAWKDLLIKDCYFHNLQGDALYVAGWDISSSNHYSGWAHGVHPKGLEFANNYVDGTTRQCLTISQGTDVWLHNNVLENVALSPYNSEDMIYGSHGERYLRNITFEDNYVTKWTWGIKDVPNGSIHNWPIMFVTRADEVDDINGLTIRRNYFDFGHAGWGNPSAEIAVYGSVQNGGAGNGGVHIMAAPAPWTGLPDAEYAENLIFTDNTFNLQPDQQNGYGIYLRNWHNVTITGNDMQGLDSRLIDCAGVTWNDNGSSTYTTSDGPPPVATRGPRAAPAVPTGSNVYTISPSIDATGATDVSSAIASWLNGLPPNSIAVFEATADTEGYEHGTDTPEATFRLDSGIGVTQTGLTLWGYGVKLDLRAAGTAWEHSAFYFHQNGSIDIRGFEIEGQNTNAGTTTAHDRSRQLGHGLALAGDHSSRVEDCWMHHLWGDGVFIAGWADTDDAPYGLEWSYNLVEMMGRYGFVVNQNDSGTAWIHHNIIRDTGLSLIGGEDQRLGTDQCLNVLVEDNDFGTFHWEDTADWTPKGINWVYSYWPPLPNVAEVGPITIRNNTWTGGCATATFNRMGSSTVFIDQRDVSASDGDYHDFTVDNNDWTGVPSAQRTVAYWTRMHNIRNVTLTDNYNLGSMASRYTTTNSSGVTVSNNT